MLAAIIHAPRDLRVEAVETPAPGPGQVAIRVRAGGICGSDLHYYQHGGFGTVRLREPMILGHEVAGEVSALGAGVLDLAVGDKVAINPSLPCLGCRFCLSGQANQCLEMRFYGSAMRWPHVQGGFRETLVCEASQAVRVPPALPLSIAAFAEPLAVCLHAAAQAGPLLGRRVLVTGCGPIGALSILVARHAGAGEIVAIDLLDPPLHMARRLGADSALHAGRDGAAIGRFAEAKGYFDVVFEASGSGLALASAIAAVRAGGTIVQIGIAAIRSRCRSTPSWRRRSCCAAPSASTPSSPPRWRSWQPGGSTSRRCSPRSCRWARQCAASSWRPTRRAR